MGSSGIFSEMFLSGPLMFLKYIYFYIIYLICISYILFKSNVGEKLCQTEKKCIVLNLRLSKLKPLLQEIFVNRKL